MTDLRDNSFITINGKRFELLYIGHDSAFSYVGPGFGFRIIDPETAKKAGALRIIVSSTTMAVWKNHTRLKDFIDESAERVVRAAMDTVIYPRNFIIDPVLFEDMLYRDDALLIQITTMDDNVAEKGAVITLKSYDSPEEFVSMNLFGVPPVKQQIRNAILQRLDKWNTLNYAYPYSTNDLQQELLLPRDAIHRAVDYLAGIGVEMISKRPAGDDEYYIKLNPKGEEFVEGLAVLDAATGNETETVLANKALFNELNSIDPELADSYEQVVRDINDPSRKSWKGTANEMREIVSATLRQLAPDDEVKKQDGFILETGQTKPTQKQKVKYILRQHAAGSKESEVTKSISDLEDRIGIFGRNLYNRSSDSAHRSKERKEIVRIYNYLVAFMGDILDV